MEQENSKYISYFEFSHSGFHRLQDKREGISKKFLLLFTLILNIPWDDPHFLLCLWDIYCINRMTLTLFFYKHNWGWFRKKKKKLLISTILLGEKWAGLPLLLVWLCGYPFPCGWRQQCQKQMRSIKGYLFKRVGKPIFRRYIIYVGYIIHIDYILYSHTLISFAELSITPLFK